MLSSNSFYQNYLEPSFSISTEFGAESVLDLLSELGELAKELLKGANYGRDDFSANDEWESELGDVLFSLICVANTTGVDLEKALDKVLEKYQYRLAKEGKIGSD